MGYVIGSGGGGLVDGSGGDLGGGSLGKGEVMGKVMKRDGGLVEAMGGLPPPNPRACRLGEAVSSGFRCASQGCLPADASR